MILDNNSYNKNFIFENCRALIQISIYEDISKLEDNFDINDNVIETCNKNKVNTTNMASKESSKNIIENIPLIENYMNQN